MKTAVASGDGPRGPRDRVGERARLIFAFLDENRGVGFTLPQLCQRLQFGPGATTRAALRKARDIATEKGLHFPPAVPANRQRYMITALPADAFDPTLHMGRIATGVRNREQVGIDFIKREKRALPSDLKPLAEFYLKTQEVRQRAAAELEKAADDMVMDLVKLRRGQRGS